jgi:hypothetical protein
MLCNHTLWVFSNLLGDENDKFYELITTKTSLIDYLAGVVNWDLKTVNPDLIKIIPWVTNNIARYGNLLSTNVVYILLLNNIRFHRQMQF